MAQRTEDEVPGGLFGALAEKAGLNGWVTAYCDGGSRGNPGPSGYGVFIQDEGGKALAELSEFLGTRTNNYAEYSGLLAALNFALEKGQYRVNSPELRPLYDEAKRRIGRLEQFGIDHVLRGKNKEADRLANLAMDRGTGRASERAAEQAPERVPGRTLDFRAAVKATSRSAAPSAKPPAPAKPLRGLVKGGVVHLLEGELPEGVFVRVTPEAK